jgi:uncharacterized membrane protein YccC
VISDPGRVNLRKASRAAIVSPVLFAVILVGFDAEITALFAAFASFAALVFCDFGGPLPARGRAYAAVLAVGVVLVALGTVVSDSTASSVAVMAVVAFAVVYLGALGGYFSAAAITVILSFVLAVMLPAPASQIWERELGWMLGAGVAGISAVVLWPVAERLRVRRDAADLADAIAALLAGGGASARAASAAARTALDSHAGMVFRPAGSATRDRALVSLLRELRIADDFVAELPDEWSDADRALFGACAATLRSVAATLRAPGDDLDVSELVRARAVNTDALTTWARSDEARTDPVCVIQRFDVEFPVRALSLRVLAIASAAAVRGGVGLVGVDVAVDEAPADLRFLDMPVAGRTAARKLADHWNLDSVRMRAALRTALGLAVAVGIGKWFDIDHAFWVVLGTLSVLRSNAFGTGVTAVQAFVGALLGFAVVAGGILLVGGDTSALWIALPITAFLAAYTPGAVHFVVGQASFTVFIVVLFNLVEPLGWRTGLVRVEDIGIGVAISLVIGVVLWPRGAHAAARLTFARMLRTASSLFVASLDHLVLTGEAGVGDVPTAADVAEARTRAVAARDRAISSLEDLSVERGGGQVDPDSWVALLEVAIITTLAGDGLERMAADGPLDGCAEARAALGSAASAVDVALEGLSRHLEAPPITAFDPPATDELRTCMTEAALAGGDLPIRLLWAREFVGIVAQRLAPHEGVTSPGGS